MAKRRIIIYLTILLAATLFAPVVALADADSIEAVLEAETQRIAVMDEAKNAVVAVFSSDGGGGGSGVVISTDGFALTNFHVVKPCGAAMKCGMADGNIYDAVVVGVDPVGDVALIKLFGKDVFPAAKMGDSDKLKVGDWCFAMGNPFLLAADFTPTVTYGIVSGTHRYQYPAGTLLEYTDCIQTDASINPGNSGGPLFNSAGELVGINGRGSFEKRGRVNVGVAYAISINQIKYFLGCLHAGRICDHATLGATVSTDDEGRVVVNNILSDCDAYRRGLRYDDELILLGNRPITTTNAFKNVLGIFPKEWRIPISFRKDGERIDAMVRLMGVHTDQELIDKVQPPPRAMPVPIPMPKPDEDQPKSDEDSPKDLDEDKAEPSNDESDKPSDEGEQNVEPADEGEQAAKPADDDGKEELPDKPQRIEIPEQIRRQLMQKKPPLPEIVKQHFEKRRGYANYYFNKLHSDRVEQDWQQLGDFTSSRGLWVFEGILVDGKRKTRIEIDPNGVRLTLPDVTYSWQVSDRLCDDLSPPQSGGLLAALYLWRRLAVEGFENFGDVRYFGTAPIDQLDKQVDVVDAIYKDAQARCYFDPVTGHLQLLEFYSADDSDPCELYFRDYVDFDGRQVPSRFEIFIGDDPYPSFQFTSYRFEPGEPAPVETESDESSDTSEEANQ